MLDKIKRIKESRIKQEELFFVNKIDGMKIFKQYKYPDCIYWEKNGIILFKHDQRYNKVYISWRDFYSDMQNIYGYSWMGSRIFLKQMINKYTNIKNASVEIMWLSIDKKSLILRKGGK